MSVTAKAKANVTSNICRSHSLKEQDQNEGNTGVQTFVSIQQITQSR